ncbi:a disintegrin and metalloproteinase with thrombospondin motifs 9 [Trichonephila inaurata madagascariensis]|uniref:A disintegrin and metalloproteinase with thrombospondin motifs 9 n=1 Tax=Trichonephila inaurata madagascariensis TaxID=2747483 RepID=A0A8X6WRU0_9ARAC|nr:a disintegrin and metalloproteinase with thrombospondin motifs 9 [Trichonephila inaurata madagascariensis]
MVVADSKMKRYHGDNLEMYILTLMTSVSLIFKDPTIGNNVNISVVKLIIMSEDEDAGIIFPSASKTLRNFCRWQQELNDPQGYYHDTAILLTREDLCRHSRTCDTLGLAQSGMACDRESSCAVVEDNGLSAAFTVAHEIGHILGIPHDDDAKCNRFHKQGQRLHVMARMLDYNSFPWTWSDCSRHFITTFLDAGYGHCLLSQSKKDLLSTYEHVKKPAGELYDMDYQCELVFGKGSRICPFMPVCKRLWCTMEDFTLGGCRTQHMPWADGTKCGPDKSCLRGECVLDPVFEAPAQNGEWGEWQSYGPCSRSCGGGVARSIRECDNPRPTNGGRYCVGERIRYKSCQTRNCPVGSTDFREEQCRSFNGKTFGFPGVDANVKWVPHYTGVEPEDSCKLYCRAARSSAYFLLKERVIDGTTCGPETYDICINGKCMAAGCDHKLYSDAVDDVCGVCDGDGTSCRVIRGKSIPLQYEGMIKAAQLSIPRRKRRNDWVPYWKDHNIEALIHERDSACNDLEKNNNIENRRKFVDICHKVEEEIAAYKREKWADFCGILDPRKDSQHWNVIKVLKSRSTQVNNRPTSNIIVSNGHKSKTDLEAANLLATNYQQASKLSFQNSDKKQKKACKQVLQQNKSYTQKDIFTKELTLEELECAIQKLDPNKSPGIDLIFGSMTKHFGTCTRRTLLRIFNLSWKSGKPPTLWKKSITIPILKHGKDAACCKLLLTLRSLTSLQPSPMVLRIPITTGEDLGSTYRTQMAQRQGINYQRGDCVQLYKKLLP